MVTHVAKATQLKYLLQVLSVSLRLVVGHHDVIEWSVSAATPRQTNAEDSRANANHDNPLLAIPEV